MSRIISADSTAGTSLHTSTAETVLKSYTIPANHFQVGKLYKFKGTVRVIDVSSGTLTVRARLGGTTLTGTVIGLSLVVTPAADGEMFAIEGWIHVTAVGTAGTAQTGAVLGGPDAAAAMGAAHSAAVTGLDTTAALLLEITGEYSVSHADNECAAYQLILEEAV